MFILFFEYDKNFYLYMLFGFFYCLCLLKRFRFIKLFFYFLIRRNKFLVKELMCIVWFLKLWDIKIDNCVVYFGSNGVIFDYFVKVEFIECDNLFMIFYGYEISWYD